MRVSVSNLDLYRSYLEDDEFPLEVFLAQLRGESKPTPSMERGRAFAGAMEFARLGESQTISMDGHTFAFTCDAVVEAWPRREVEAEKDYGGIVISARCDRLIGRTIADDKTSHEFDAEKYIAKFQWRYYLDIFDADVFRWHIWECREIKHTDPSQIAWEVYAHHLLTQYRYDRLEEDCHELAQDFRDFAHRIGWEGSQRTA